MPTRVVAGYDVDLVAPVVALTHRKPGGAVLMTNLRNPFCAVVVQSLQGEPERDRPVSPQVSGRGL